MSECFTFQDIQIKSGESLMLSLLKYNLNSCQPHEHRVNRDNQYKKKLPGMGWRKIQKPIFQG